MATRKIGTISRKYREKINDRFAGPSRKEIEQQHIRHLENQINRLNEENDRRTREDQERQRQLKYQRDEEARQRREKEQSELNEQAILQRQRDLEIQYRENQRLEVLRKTEPESLRHLRQLIRTRYQMDIEIWRLRGTMRANHKVVIEMGRKSDAVLYEIYDIVDSWDYESGAWTAAEWKVAKKIKDRLAKRDQRVWEGNPPWNEPEPTMNLAYR